MLRADAHPAAATETADCLHFCWASEPTLTWVRALATLLERRRARGRSGSGTSE